MFGIGPTSDRLRWEVIRFRTFTGLRPDGIKVAPDVLAAYIVEQGATISQRIQFNGIPVVADDLPCGAVLVMSTQGNSYPFATPSVERWVQQWETPVKLIDRDTCARPLEHKSGCECATL